VLRDEKRGGWARLEGFEEWENGPEKRKSDEGRRKCVRTSHQLKKGKRSLGLSWKVVQAVTRVPTGMSCRLPRCPSTEKNPKERQWGVGQGEWVRRPSEGRGSRSVSIATLRVLKEQTRKEEESSKTLGTSRQPVIKETRKKGERIPHMRTKEDPETTFNTKYAIEEKNSLSNKAQWSKALDILGRREEGWRQSELAYFQRPFYRRAETNGGDWSYARRVESRCMPTVSKTDAERDERTIT